MAFRFDNSYARLPDSLFHRQPPEYAPEPRIVLLNRALAEGLGIDIAALDGAEGAALLSGNRLAPGAEPIAMAYAGHQFGGWVPQLGDGRAILLGEHVAPDGSRHDIHIKGAGRTPFSRGGDGRAALGPVLREYLVSEAMAALGIPTTRALAALTTGERVIREDGPLPGARIVRLAASHIRVGTFQYAASRGDLPALKALLDHAIWRHDPQAGRPADQGARVQAFLQGVMERQADLVAAWMGVGFIHGVMNTDNMAVSGETIDYGPCAFMDDFHRGRVFSSIDRGGRYAWGNQPGIAHWNIAQLAQALLPLVDSDPARAVDRLQEVVDGFGPLMGRAWNARFAAKLGLPGDHPEAPGLIDGLLKLMEDCGADFTLTFRALTRLAEGEEAAAFTALFPARLKPEDWLARWQQAVGVLERDEVLARMRAANPVRIPRNHRVEQALQAAMAGDMGPFRRLEQALARPCDPDPDLAEYEAPPAPDEVVHATFCGT